MALDERPFRVVNLSSTQLPSPLDRSLSEASLASSLSLLPQFKPPDAASSPHLTQLPPPVFTIGVVAGVSREQGRDNGHASMATFSSPFGVLLDRRGSLLVSDGQNHCIRRVIRNATFEIQCLNVRLWACWGHLAWFGYDQWGFAR